MIGLRAGAATDVGLVRTNNQDHLLVASPIFAVADGMGGHAAGEVASETAIAALREAFEAGAGSDGLLEAMRTANRAVWDRAAANRDYAGMGTTLTVVARVGQPEDAKVAVANVGDSRTYRLRGDDFQQLTVDHSLVAELVAEGQIDAEEAERHPQRHVLTRALGVHPEVDVDVVVHDAQIGDRFLLCSDGLSREVSDSQIASLLRRLDDPADAAGELVSRARSNGGSDNITVVVVDVVDPADEVAVVAADEAADEEDREDPGKGAATAAVDAGGAAPAGGWFARRRARRAAGASSGSSGARVRVPRRRVLSVRVVAFLILLLAVAAIGAGGTFWYARAAYFVRLDGDRLVIYRGRPGGVLGIQPVVAQVTTTTGSQVEPYHLPALRAGVPEPSLASARRYVANLRAEAVAAGLTAAASPVAAILAAAGP